MTESNLEKLIEDFKKKYKMEDCAILCRSKPDLIEAIEVAVSAENEINKVDRHQCRVGRYKLKVYREKLIGEKFDSIRSCKDFDTLYNTIEACKMKGIGLLTKYDISIRIAYYLYKKDGNPNILPNMIYLHRGAKDGARNLLGSDKVSKRKIPREILPSPLRESSLSCDEIESFLCSYKNKLEKVN